MLLFFMLTSALRAAGDARTPLRLGVTMTILNVILNVILIRGLGPIPALGTAGSALGTVIASSTVSAYALFQLFKGKLVIKFSRHMDWRPDWTIIRSLFRFGLPTGVQGIAMNVAGVMLLRFIGSLRAERRRAGRLCDRLHRVVLADYVDVGGVDGRGRDDRRTEPRRRPSRARHARRAHRLAHRPRRRCRRRA